MKVFTEALEHVLRGTEGRLLRAHLFVPGFVFTGMSGADTGKEKPAGAWTAEQTVDYLFARMATYVSAAGQTITQRTARFYPYDHLPGGVLVTPPGPGDEPKARTNELLSRARAPESWQSVRIAASRTRSRAERSLN